MAFILNDETAADVLIFWIQSSDGALSYWEDEAVKDALNQMNYDMSTYISTLSYLGALSTEHLEELIDEARAYARTNYDQDQKRHLIELLKAIALADENAGKFEQEKLQNLHVELGV